jgi:hypothetical protein
MTPEEYVKIKMMWLVSRLSQAEYGSLARLHLMARDFESGERALVTRDANKLGIAINWRKGE